MASRRLRNVQDEFLYGADMFGASGPGARRQVAEPSASRPSRCWTPSWAPGANAGARVAVPSASGAKPAAARCSRTSTRSRATRGVPGTSPAPVCSTRCCANSCTGGSARPAARWSIPSPAEACGVVATIMGLQVLGLRPSRRAGSRRTNSRPWPSACGRPGAAATAWTPCPRRPRPTSSCRARHTATPERYSDDAARPVGDGMAHLPRGLPPHHPARAGAVEGRPVRLLRGRRLPRPAGFYRNFVGDTVAAFEGIRRPAVQRSRARDAIGTGRLRVTNQFNGGRKMVKTHQNVLVFCRATRARRRRCAPSRRTDRVAPRATLTLCVRNALIRNARIGAFRSGDNCRLIRSGSAAWSPAAPAWGQVVVGSNPATPTKIKNLGA